MKNDDSDIKIAGDVFRPEHIDDDAEETRRLLDREKANGNLNRARRLGAIMADDVTAVDGGHPIEDPARMTQRRILLAFAVKVGLDALLPNALLAQTALSIFYDTLRQTAPTFYEDLQESGAFSFYYLCIRDGRNVEKCVGEAYASLCGKTGNQELADKGTGLYIHFIDQVRSFAESLEFVFESDAQFTTI